MEDENFRKELEDLFKLFKVLIEKEASEGLQDMDPQQVEQLKAFMAQFDDVKEKLKVEQVHVDPFSKMMVSSLVKQLRQQLGPDALRYYEEEEEPRIAIDQATTVEAIDNLLRNPDLTDQEIDDLLDKRMQILSHLP
ncbi:MAG: hypothetical protein K6F96_00520 [Bacteroidales bacterium]|nr:hypothetical protein [Bacteroidales bacterium]